MSCFHFSKLITNGFDVYGNTSLTNVSRLQIMHNKFLNEIWHDHEPKSKHIEHWKYTWKQCSNFCEHVAHGTVFRNFLNVSLCRELKMCQRKPCFRGEPRIIYISCSLFHDDVIIWKYFPCYWPFVPVTGEFPAQRPVTRSFDIFFASTNSWVNNGDASGLIRHRAHYDVIVMSVPNYVVCINTQIRRVNLQTRQCIPIHALPIYASIRTYRCGYFNLSYDIWSHYIICGMSESYLGKQGIY